MSERPSRSNSSLTLEREPLHHIVVATDFSARAEQALVRATKLPLAETARIDIVHVLPELPRAYDTRAVRSAQSELDALAGVAKEQRREAKVATKLLRGDPARVIAALATEAKPDLLVIGRHGKRPLRDLFLGSTAEKIARHCTTPVLLVNRPPRSEYRRPIVAIDTDETSMVAMDFMGRAVSPTVVRHLVHAFEPLLESSIMGLNDEERARLRHDCKLAALEALGPVRRRLQLAKIPHTLTLKLGPPRTVLIKAIEHKDSDLIALGTHARSGVSYAFLGSVAADVLREAPCDVLVVRPSRLRVKPL
ncbi:MAG: universal stress protein [Deltaproteobacteria bacterium]|nr:universal stress protein [Deltaproteobacteria bacterium]